MAPPKLHGNGAKAEALKHWIMLATSGMGTSSPAEVLTNFIRILEGASPRLRLLIALSTPWAMLLAAVAGYARVWSTINTAKSYLADSLYSSITIPDTHPMNKQVLSYVAEQGLGNNARALALSMSQVDAKQLSATMQAHYDDIYGYGRGPRGPQKHRHAESDEDDKPVLAYVPDVGTYSFWFKYHRFTLVRQPNLRQEMDIKGKMQWIHTSSAAIKISCFSLFGGAGPIKDFLKYVQDIPTKERTTTIFRPQQNGSTWDAGITRPSRNLNAVTLDTKIKDGLVKDIETYLTPETKRYYANRGIPWRRGFLFYGHPGCGKTSFTNALAGHFNLNVYMLSLSTTALTDVILESLFEQLPNKCIVLLEDIDSAGISRENMKEKARAKTKRNQR